MAKKVSNTYVAPINSIQVRVVDYPHGLRVFENVQMARIISDTYNLLIMSGHIPTLGEIKGKVEIVKERDIETLDNVHAFYMHREDVLSILIKE